MELKQVCLQVRLRLIKLKRRKGDKQEVNALQRQQLDAELRSRGFEASETEVDLLLRGGNIPSGAGLRLFYRNQQDLAQQLRRNQQNNIRLQRYPNGTGYEPRRVTGRTKKGRIKRQMFDKLRTTKYLKTAATADSASVQFDGQVQWIARVHHYGLRDRVSRRGPVVRYAERRLLGVNSEVESLSRDLLLMLLIGNVKK